MISFLVSYPFLKVAVLLGEKSYLAKRRGLSLRLANVKRLDIHKNYYHIGCLKASEVLLRKVEMPLRLRGEAFTTALSFKAEEELPFSRDEMAWVLLSKKRPHATILATTQEKVNALGPDFDAVSSVPSALVQLVSRFTLPEHFLIIHRFEEEICFIEMNDKEPTVLTTIKRGPSFQKEIERLKAIYGWNEKTPVLMLGEPLDLGFTTPLFLKPAYGFSEEELRFQALAIGLAMLPFYANAEVFDLKRKPLAFKRLIIPLGRVATVGLAAFVLFYMAGERWNFEKRRVLKDRLSHLASLKKNEEFAEALARAEKENSKTLYPFPLRPETPIFSDFMAWVSALVPEGVQINKIHYGMPSLPTLKSPKERYLVQVDIVFQSTDAAAARLFHERLIAPNPFIVVDSHFAWNSSSNGYVASFRLKDRTLYFS